MRHRQLIKLVRRRPHRTTHRGRTRGVNRQRLRTRPRIAQHPAQTHRVRNNPRAHRERLAIGYRHITQGNLPGGRTTHRGRVRHAHARVRIPQRDHARTSGRRHRARNVDPAGRSRHHPAHKRRAVRRRIANRHRARVGKRRRIGDRRAIPSQRNRLRRSRCRKTIHRNHTTKIKRTPICPAERQRLRTCVADCS